MQMMYFEIYSVGRLKKSRYSMQMRAPPLQMNCIQFNFSAVFYIFPSVSIIMPSSQ